MNSADLRQPNFLGLRALTPLLFPPSDLYARLVSEYVDVSAEKEIFVGKFRHKYAGLHSVNLVFSPESAGQFDYFNTPKNTPLKVRVQIISSSGRKVLDESPD